VSPAATDLGDGGFSLSTLVELEPATFMIVLSIFSVAVFL
jgi:hypothetical protein